MASAQVLPNSAASSRKQAHLQVGKKKLEEFRKKKAEERAKKASSIGQLQSNDGGSSGKPYPNHDYEGAITSSSTGTGFSGADTTSMSNVAFTSTDKHDSSSNTKALSTYTEKSGYTGLVNGFHDHWKERNELSDNPQSKLETTTAVNVDHLSDFGSIHTNGSHEETMCTLSFYTDPSYEMRDSSSAQISYPDGFTSASLQKFETASAESRLGVPSTSQSSNFAVKDSSPALGIINSDSFKDESLVDFQAGRKTISEYISQHLNLEKASWHSSESSLPDYDLQIKRSQDAYSSPSTSYGVITSRSRPSFLDTLGVSRSSTTSHAPLYEPQKANTVVSFSDTNIRSADVHFPSHQDPFTNVGTLQQPLSSPHSELVKEKVKSFVSNEIQIPERSREYLHGNNEDLVPKKDDEFSALEQHIEDLTQEKFALQRALDSSRSLTESLAAENSSLTESYNQQAKVVSELKFEIERLQEEVKVELGAVESLKLECGNAQLECNAADERAKMLASEVIGLEEKALRLRSNELKLEKQLESLSSEIAIHKRKVSSLEKERQDFQLTINAMQEEKKALQSKLRKASSSSKVDDALKVSSSRRDMSTSTDDLGDGLGRQTNEAEIMASNDINALRNGTSFKEFKASTSSEPNARNFYLPDTSMGFPHDQHRMIDNINSLISELAVEKEELIHALTFETSNGSKLKDLNKELTRKLEAQTQRLELLTAQRMANEHSLTKPADTHIVPDTMEYADEGDEVVERVLGWIMKFFPGGSSKRRSSKLL